MIRGEGAVICDDMELTFIMAPLIYDKLQFRLKYLWNERIND